MYKELNVPKSTSLPCSIADTIFQLYFDRTDDPLNGVTTADIVRIQKHILGQNRITSPLILLAADVTQSKSISAADILEIRKLLLGYTQKFPKVNSWIYVEAGTKFKDSNLPWDDFQNPYVLKLPFVTSPQIIANLNFIGIKMGDVNDSAKQCFESSSDRSRRMELLTNTQESSTTLHYTLSTTQTNTLEGIQFALRYDADALEFESISSDVMDITAENYYIDPSGIIKFSWSDPNMLHIDAKDKIINIHFHKKNIAALGNIYLDNSVMPSEWIDGNDEISNIKFVDTKVARPLDIINISPNPANKVVVLNIYSPTERKIRIGILNMQQQLEYQQFLTLNSDINSSLIDCSNLIDGIYQLIIDDGDTKITKKLVIMK